MRFLWYPSIHWNFHWIEDRRGTPDEQGLFTNYSKSPNFMLQGLIDILHLCNMNYGTQGNKDSSELAA